MKRFLTRLLLANLLLICTAAQAQLETTAFPMFGSPIDGASVGRGGAGVAYAEVLSSISLNPAHILQIKRWESFYDQQFFGSSGVPGLNYFMAGGAYRLTDKDIVGATIRRFGFTVPSDNTGNGGSFDMSIGLLYGRQLTPRLSAAVNVQFLRRSVGTFVNFADPEQSLAANSVAADVGLVFSGLLKASTISLDLPLNPELADMEKQESQSGIALGVSLLNFGPRVSLIDGSESDPLPLMLSTGITYHVLTSPVVRLDAHADFQKLLLDSDGTIPKAAHKALFSSWRGKPFKESSYHFGADMMLFSVFLLQYGHIYDPSQPQEGFQHTNSFGIALQTRYFSIHYSQWLEDAPQSIINDNNYLLGITFGELEL